MTAEHYHALHSWMDAHPAVSRCVVALDRWLPLIPFSLSLAYVYAYVRQVY